MAKLAVIVVTSERCPQHLITVGLGDLLSHSHPCDTPAPGPWLSVRRTVNGTGTSTVPSIVGLRNAAPELVACSEVEAAQRVVAADLEPVGQQRL
ncbi:hypothetical protein GAY31_24995 [Azospirillum brasilense]|nr:hypothetical protein [Azospirillum brasilense]